MDEYISIIIAAYNSENFIERCLNSVLAAADDSCEIIVVDDGSDDDTLSIASSFEDTDDRVTVYSIKHSGSSAARKYGVDNCNGDSVMFVDSDDTLPINAIAELRNASGEEYDIVCGNIIHHEILGEKRLLYSGQPDVISGTEYAKICLQRGFDSLITGKKFARYLFDITEWNSDARMAILNERVHLVQLACTATKVHRVPTAIVYTYISRHYSQSNMFSLRLDGVELAWDLVRALPMPTKDLAQWGLDVIDQTIIERGFPFPNDYAPAVELRKMAKKADLPPKYKDIARLLGSEKRRLRRAQKNLQKGTLTLSTPIVSFIIPIYNNANEFTRTVKSIIKTGLRNIEIIAVDDGSNRKTSVKLSELAITCPRILLHRNPTNLGVAQCRRTGLNLSHGSVIFFLEAGDCVSRDGVFQAALSIGDGADLAYFKVKSSSPILPFFSWDYFVPSKSNILRAGIETMLESHIRRGYLNNNLRAIAVRRRFIDADMLCERGVKYGSGYISMLKILMARPKIAFGDSCGYINCRRETLYKQSSKHLCRLDVELSLRTLNILLKSDMNNDEVRKLVAEGSFNSLSNIIAAVMANPINGRAKAIKLAKRLCEYNLYAKLYDHLYEEMPTAEMYLKRAHEIFKNNKLRYLLGHQQNY